MTKAFFLICFSLITGSLFSQDKPGTSSAKVAVTILNTKGKPRKGEEVLFISEKQAAQYSCRTDAAGKGSTTLPAGDTYTIKIKTLTDTAMYSTLEIPALQPGHFYSAPFAVEIEFEPPQSFTLNNVHFDTGKPTLRSESFNALNEIASFMKSQESETYEIGGHTDNVGKEEDNLKLSQARAASVKAYLVSKGIKAIRISAKGYGATKPIADNSTEEGRQANRRTELTIL